METLRIELTTHGRWRLLNICGRIDQETANALADQLYDALVTWSPLAVCLAEAELGDPAWLPVIIDTHHQAVRMGRTFAVVASDDTAEAVLSLLARGMSPGLHVVRHPADLNTAMHDADAVDPAVPSLQSLNDPVS